MSVRDWQAFVVVHGSYARLDHLVSVLGEAPEAITLLRRRGVCTTVARRRAKDFNALFTLWHGRPPRDDEWPRPRRFHARGEYEWQAPELALLASLVGRMGAREITTALTTRLQQLTGDPTAMRSLNSVRVKTNRIGLLASDVVGGLTVAEAAREIGTRAIVNHEIRTKKLRVVRVGRLWVIPYDEWTRFKAGRVFPPAGFERLASLKKKLGIGSDKLSEWARQGFIPTAVRCNPYGTKERSTQFGTWYIDATVARKILADRRAGRPMPWHGKPDQGNLTTTWRLWQSRRHPEACATCRDIWGAGGAPRTFDEYSQRYPPLLHGAKRHLTKPFAPGLTVEALCQETHRSVSHVTRAIANGQLRVRVVGRTRYIARADATRWKARGCPTGEDEKAWITLPSATKFYGFTETELRRFIRAKRLRTRIGINGPQRGLLYVPRHQCAELRETIGYGEREAARRVGVSVARLRVLLRQLEWRPAAQIPLATIRAAQQRQESQEGVSLQEAARILGKPVAWIHQQIYAGTFRVLRTKWDKRRRYVSMPMFKRLCEAALHPPKAERWSKDWLQLSDAGDLARVSVTTLMRWAEDGEVKRRPSSTGWRYHRRSVMARARAYWQTVRFKRATPPAWLQQNRQGKAA